jgi:hypothetical protein
VSVPALGFYEYIYTSAATYALGSGNKAGIERPSEIEMGRESES